MVAPVSWVDAGVTSTLEKAFDWSTAERVHAIRTEGVRHGVQHAAIACKWVSLALHQQREF